MSHSQFHSTNLFILRHAWLNLWDKHMTTGRINQVTTCTTSGRSLLRPTRTHHPNSTLSAFGGRRFRSQAVLIAPINSIQKSPLQCTIAFYRSVLADHMHQAKETPWFPFSQVSSVLLPVQRTEITAFKEDYQQPAAPERHAQSRRIPNYLFVCRSSHRQSIHIL